MSVHENNRSSEPKVNSTVPSLSRKLLPNFDMSEKTGFIPSKTPLTTLPPYFKKWEEVVNELSKLLREKRLRQVVNKLPALDFSENTLKTTEEWQRALVMLCGLTQGYLWQEGQDGVPSKIPSVLAIPFDRVSRYFGLPPVMTYASSVLYNWGLRDLSQPITAENLYALVNLTGTESESWFFMISLMVELGTVPAVNAIVDGIGAMAAGDNSKLIECLATIENTLQLIEQMMNRMRERCNPKIFYIDVRPYLSGTDNKDAFPNGMIYEGVNDSKPMKFSGGSAAQSSSIKSIDIFLGIKHRESDASYLQKMLGHMPTKHRQFLEALSQQPCLQSYVEESGDSELIAQYKATVQAFVDFRTNHLKLVALYVVAQKDYTINPCLEEKGTGGTNFMNFLKGCRDSTKNLLTK